MGPPYGKLPNTIPIIPIFRDSYWNSIGKGSGGGSLKIRLAKVLNFGDVANGATTCQRRALRKSFFETYEAIGWGEVVRPADSSDV